MKQTDALEYKSLVLDKVEWGKWDTVKFYNILRLEEEMEERKEGKGMWINNSEVLYKKNFLEADYLE